MRRPNCSGLCAALVVLWSTALSATTVRGFDTRGLVDAADVIVRASVVGNTSFWNAAHDRIYTDTLVRPTEVIYVSRAPRTQPPTLDAPTLPIRQLGGRVGDVTMTVPGTARLAPGDDVVVFLRRHAGFYTLVGMAQGRVLLRTTASGVEASRDHGGAHVLPRKRLVTGPDVQTAPEPARESWTNLRPRLDALIEARRSREAAR